MSHDDAISLHCTCILLFPQQMLQSMPPQGNSLTDICQNLVRSRYNVAYYKESKGENNFLISSNDSKTLGRVGVCFIISQFLLFPQIKMFPNSSLTVSATGMNLWSPQLTHICGDKLSSLNFKKFKKKYL